MHVKFAVNVVSLEKTSPGKRVVHMHLTESAKVQQKTCDVMPKILFTMVILPVTPNLNFFIF